MKKILSILLSLMCVLSIVSCAKQESPAQQESSAQQESPTQQEEPADITRPTVGHASVPCSFIGEQERLSWQDKIIAVLSKNECYEEKDFGGLGVALMDFNFDNTPEVIVSYKGGSMGNVGVSVYDLESGEALCYIVATPHYEDIYQIYLCVHQNDNGDLILVNKGSLRDGLEWYDLTALMNEDYELDFIFGEVFSSHKDNCYYYQGCEVDKAEFDAKQETFQNEYKAISETLTTFVYWSDMKSTTKDEMLCEMAHALVTSEQQFVDYRS